jgi:hypothetical protein
MGLLRWTAGLVLAAIGVARGLAACEAVVPPGQFFNPAGITAVVSYANSAPPQLLTAAGDYVFYAEADNLYRLAASNPTSPVIVPVALRGPFSALAFDGQSTVAFCAGGVLGAVNVASMTTVPLPEQAPGACLRLALTAGRIAYTSQTDAGALSVVTAPLDGGAPSSTPLANDAGMDPTHATVAIADDTTYYLWRSAMVAVGVPYVVGNITEPCRVAFLTPPNDPKVVVFDAGSAAGPMTSMILRVDSSDTLKRVDLPDPAKPTCCTGTVTVGGPCIRYPLAQQAPGGEGDFTVAGSQFYYGDDGLLSRLPLTIVTSDAGPIDAGHLVDVPGGAPMPSVAIVDQRAFFILGHAIFEAPLPAGD